MPQGISLFAEPGSLTALMGGSGAGKTVRHAGLHAGLHCAACRQSTPAPTHSGLGSWLVASTTQCLVRLGVFHHIIQFNLNPLLPAPRLQTLMDVILGRKTVGLVRGDILVRGGLWGSEGGLPWGLRVNEVPPCLRSACQSSRHPRK